LIYPFIAKYTGPVRIWRVMALSMAPIVALFPTLSLVAREDLTVLLWVLLITLMSARIVTVQCLFTPTMIIVNNSAKPESVGSVNGLAQVCTTPNIVPIALDGLFAIHIDVCAWVSLVCCE
jgi:hypothetical protein